MWYRMDLRLIEVHDLLIEESILTGESEAAEKNTALLSDDVPAGDQKNMAFSGTMVQTGSAFGVVVETGDATEIGKINQALQSVQQQTTPLVKKIHQLNLRDFSGHYCADYLPAVFYHLPLWDGVAVDVLGDDRIDCGNDS